MRYSFEFVWICGFFSVNSGSSTSALRGYGGQAGAGLRRAVVATATQAGARVVNELIRLTFIMPHSILFICSGNVCRSPMAEYMLKTRLGSDSDWEVGSAGISAVSGMRASAEGVKAAADINVDMTSHRSRPVHARLVDAADLIVVMTVAHRRQMEILFQQAADRIYLLKTFDSEAKTEDIEDPIGMPVETYRNIRDEIGSALPGLMEFMKTFSPNYSPRSHGGHGKEAH